LKSGRHQVRQHEIAYLAGYFPAGSSILEVGAGTGEQARELTRRGFSVKAIDVPTSEYGMHRVFDVQDYDGRRIPFPDASFDIVFSSNVLEHLPDLPGMLAEMRRVLKPGGYCVHAMPTPAWRVGTAVAGYADAVLFVGRKRKELPAARLLRGAVARMIPRRHGVRGNSLTELWLFRAESWRRVFAANGYTIVDEHPMGLFYTGYHVLGERLPIRARESAARILGSACRVYVVRPGSSAAAAPAARR
jgi:ubiquinone/menaquinone biosynthesis C-methylase UbiE